MREYYQAMPYDAIFEDDWECTRAGHDNNIRSVIDATSYCIAQRQQVRTIKHLVVTSLTVICLKLF